MTALCGGGTSSSRAAFGASVSVGIAQLAALLNNVPTPVAFALAGYIGLVAYDLSTFCATDPPAMPTPSAGDWVAALTVSDPVSHLTAIQKFQAMFANLLWPTFCQCDAGAQPSTPSLPTPPTNLPTVNPTALPTAPAGVPCWDQQSTFHLPAGSSTIDMTSGLLPSANRHTITPGGGGEPTTAAVIPPGASNMMLTYSLDVHATVTASSAQVEFFNAAGTSIQRSFFFDDNGLIPLSGSTTPSIPSTAVYFNAFGGNGGTTPQNATLSVSFFCASSTPGTLATPCCPPDPSQSALLQTILQLVQGIYQGLPTDLNSFAESTVHSGLSGNGTVPIGAQTIAVKVSITTDIAGGVIDVASPSYYFNRGYIVPITLEAPIAATRKLVYNPQVFMLPKLTEQVGYSLPVGLVISITELVPGP